jgi:hypothetical protein
MMSIGFMSESTGRPAHQGCVLDYTGRVLAERSFAHTGEAIAAFAQWLQGVAGGDPGQAAIAIEVPRGAVVETLSACACKPTLPRPQQYSAFRFTRSSRHLRATFRHHFHPSIESAKTLFLDVAR